MLNELTFTESQHRIKWDHLWKGDMKDSMVLAELWNEMVSLTSRSKEESCSKVGGAADKAGLSRAITE